MTAACTAVAEGHFLRGISLAFAGSAYILITTLSAVLERDDSPHHTAVTVGDMLLVTAIVWLTGGLQSEYYLLYYLPIATAGLRLDSRNGIAACLLAGALYVFVALIAEPAHAVLSQGPVRVLSLCISALVLVVLFSLLKREVKLCADLRQTFHSSLGRMAAVYDMAHAANTRADLAAVLSILLEHAARAAGAANGSISLLVGENRLKPMASLSAHSPADAPPTTYPAEPAHQAIANRSSVTITTSLPHGPAAPAQTAALVYIPLITPGGALGVLTLVSRPGRRFAPRHVDFLQSLCSEAALAIENSQLRSELGRLAITDHLTGLPNRREIERHLRAESERSADRRRPLAVLLIDVDNLKDINDRFGHAAGDEILRALGDMLQTSPASSHVAGRLGGDEFLVVLSETVLSRAAGLADQLIERFDTVLRGWPELGAFPSAASLAGLSIGVAATNGSRLSAEELTARADAALYRAKRSGKNCSCVADSDSDLAGLRARGDDPVTT